MGVSGLSLCGPNGWKDSMEVCLPLQAVVNTTASPNAQSQLQGDYCSFARAVIKRIPKRNATILPSTCKPHNGNMYYY